MRRTHFTSAILLVSLILSLIDCKGREATSNSEGKSKPAASNANRPDDNVQPNQASVANRNATASNGVTDSTKAPAGPSPQLVGTYQAMEVQEKGFVTLFSKIRTLINFAPEGTYSRVSQNKGKTYHSDSGLFRIEPPDRLVLTIQVSDKNIQSPPLERTHIFSLSPDGDELKMTSKGKIAVFRRVSMPKAS